jgi:hypothetical protein
MVADDGQLEGQLQQGDGREGYHTVVAAAGQTGRVQPEKIQLPGMGCWCSSGLAAVPSA